MNFYQGGGGQRGSGADNLLRETEAQGEARAGALDVVSKILQQSQQLRQQRQMMEDEQRFKSDEGARQRAHEMSMRQLIEQGWTSRAAIEAEQRAAEGEANRDERMKEAVLREQGDTFRAFGQQRESALNRQQIAKDREADRSAREQDRIAQERGDTEREAMRQAQEDRRAELQANTQLEVAGVRLNGKPVPGALTPKVSADMYAKAREIARKEADPMGLGNVDESVIEKRADRILRRMTGEPDPEPPKPTETPTGGVEQSKGDALDAVRSRKGGKPWSEIDPQTRQQAVDDAIRALSSRDSDSLASLYDKYDIQQNSGFAQAIRERQKGTGPIVAGGRDAQAPQPVAPSEPTKEQRLVDQGAELRAKLQANGLRAAGFTGADPLQDRDSLLAALAYATAKGAPTDALVSYGRSRGWIR